MSDSMPLDPSRGFVALPLDVLEIEMSPGAFRTLVEFCRMADADGICWPSLEQLGARLSRSRAAISGYVRELRELALVETETQRTANGFNYRLRFRVTFWRTWKSRFRRPSERPAPERRVHSTERPVKKNQIHENQPADQRPAGPDPIKLNRTWLTHIAGAPYPTFSTPPPENLIARTHDCLQRHPPVSTDMKPILEAFFAERGIPLPAETLTELGTTTAGLSAVPNAPTLLHDALASAWRPHWQRPPSGAFIEAIVARIAAENPAPLAARLLAGHLRRGEFCRKSLRQAA